MKLTTGIEPSCGLSVPAELHVAHMVVIIYDLSSICYYWYFTFIRSTSESRPNSIEGKNVRPYVRPSTKSFFNLNEIWYIGRGR